MWWTIDYFRVGPCLLVELLKVGFGEFTGLHVCLDYLPSQFRFAGKNGFEHRSMTLYVHLLHLLHYLGFFSFRHSTKTNGCIDQKITEQYKQLHSQNLFHSLIMIQTLFYSKSITPIGVSIAVFSISHFQFLGQYDVCVV